ncbi:MAG TPA: hypothetical protein VFS10_23160, partial [Pyrinomonadaceae bacterium]|nr:hypothetical protein [Pyrinomonadaceae bacterium]
MFRNVLRPRLALACALATFAVVLLTVSPASLFARQQQQPAPPQGMGVSTGAGVVSATRRTAGVTDAKAPRVFE